MGAGVIDRSENFLEVDCSEAQETAVANLRRGRDIILGLAAAGVVERSAAAAAGG